MKSFKEYVTESTLDDLWKSTEKLIRGDVKRYPKHTAKSIIDREKRQVAAQKMDPKDADFMNKKIEALVAELKPDKPKKKKI